MIVLARFVALSLVCCTSTQVQRTKQLNTLTVNKRSKDKLQSVQGNGLLKVREARELQEQVLQGEI